PLALLVDREGPVVQFLPVERADDRLREGTHGGDLGGAQRPVPREGGEFGHGILARVEHHHVHRRRSLPHLLPPHARPGTRRGPRQPGGVQGTVRTSRPRTSPASSRRWASAVLDSGSRPAIRGRHGDSRSSRPTARAARARSLTPALLIANPTMLASLV